MVEDKKISPNKGVGIVFDYDGKKCITLPRTSDYSLEVDAEITTYAGLVWYAIHFYASLRVHDLRCKVIDDDSDKIFCSNMQPKESLFNRIDVTAISKQDIYTENENGRKIIDVKKGYETSRFDNIEDCIEAIESTFNEMFDEPWVLKRSCREESWEESKRKTIEFYNKHSK